MIVRSKAPLRLGFAGGGTDVESYSSQYGGVILNATIDMYSYVTLTVNETNKIKFEATDIGQSYESNLIAEFELEGDCLLHKAIYNRIVKDFNDGEPLAVSVVTHSDAPPGSGLGSSSTMVVAILGAYRTLLNLPLGEYELARLAYEIERIDCGLEGGKQDQYAATFGGFNYMEFLKDNNVLINPLRIRNFIVNELQCQLMLYFTGVSRDSAKIIKDQVKSVTQKDTALNALHEVKAQAFDMKQGLLQSDFMQMINVLKLSWNAKKRTSSSISNPHIEKVETTALENGAKALKLSGAGGGGFMMMFIEPERRMDLTRALESLGGNVVRFQFVNHGVQAWTI